jgi:hypothetical protein
VEGDGRKGNWEGEIRSENSLRKKIDVMWDEGREK